MPPTQAKGGFGTKFRRDDGTGTFTDVAEIMDVSGPALSHIVVDATNQGSPDGWAEKIAVGLKEAGDITFQMSLLQDDASQNMLLTDLASTTKRNFQIVHPSGTKRLSFSGFVQAIGHTFPLRDKLVQDVTISVTGKVTKEAHP